MVRPVTQKSSTSTLIGGTHVPAAEAMIALARKHPAEAVDQLRVAAQYRARVRRATGARVRARVGAARAGRRAIGVGRIPESPRPSRRGSVLGAAAGVAARSRAIAQERRRRRACAKGVRRVPAGLGVGGPGDSNVSRRAGRACGALLVTVIADETPLSPCRVRGRRGRCAARTRAGACHTGAAAGAGDQPYTALGPASLPHDGVPKGEIRGPFILPSQAYPGTQHTYWVYVPAQYDPECTGEPDDLSGRPGVQGRWTAISPGPERARQPDLPARDSGHDRACSSIRVARPSNRSRRRANGAIARRTGRPNTTRSTTSTRV